MLVDAHDLMSGAHFVRATIPHVQTLMKERERMEKEKHPEPPAEDDEEMHGDSEMEEE